MNNQFSQRVSDIITYSKEEANRLRNRYIGPEHLLLGMLRDGGGKAIEILLKLDIDLKRVKSRLEGFLAPQGHGRARAEESCRPTLPRGASPRRDRPRRDARLRARQGRGGKVIKENKHVYYLP